MVNTYLKNKKTCGTIGARLYFENNTIQHAGISVLGTINDNNQFGLKLGHEGFMTEYGYPTEDSHDSLGITAALLMVSRELFVDVGYFPKGYLFSLSDVEFNLSMWVRGKKNCFNFYKLFTSAIIALASSEVKPVSLFMLLTPISVRNCERGNLASHTFAS